MLHRLDTLHLWLSSACSLKILKLEPLAGDASFRKYYRILVATSSQKICSYIVMDAPPELEDISSFIHVQNLFHRHQICVPQIYHHDLNQGFLVLEDFGDTLLLHQLTPANVTAYYVQSMNIILKLQTIQAQSSLPHFDFQHISKELQLFVDWFLIKHLQLKLHPDEHTLIQTCFEHIAIQLSQHTQTLIHRDFHSRNLMVLPNQNLGLIDFQDAMIGPRCYDLVSILKDCYITWPSTQIEQWLHYFHQQLTTSTPFIQFKKEFILCGLQRHLKVLGIFCRIHYRDHKSQYLDDLPLVWTYVMHALKELDMYHDLFALLQTKVQTSLAKLGHPC